MRGTGLQSCQPLRIGCNLLTWSRLYYAILLIMKLLHPPPTHTHTHTQKKTPLKCLFSCSCFCVSGERERVHQQLAFLCGCTTASQLLHLTQAGQLWLSIHFPTLTGQAQVSVLQFILCCHAEAESWWKWAPVEWFRNLCNRHTERNIQTNIHVPWIPPWGSVMYAGLTSLSVMLAYVRYCGCMLCSFIWMCAVCIEPSYYS